uniref:Expressed protein n=2 Tax=Oryza sativa subsp. japonica TaxID=39947 RepID=Q7XD19_ORYSJ|nr:expressed protein [Oryza sativa Japonica Group]
MLAAAAAGYRAVAPDWRGYGLSGQPPEQEEATWDDLVADVLAILDALAVPGAFLVGKDFGAMPAYDFALRHPARTRGVACLGVPFSPAPASFDAMPEGFYVLRWRVRARRRRRHCRRRRLFLLLTRTRCVCGGRRRGGRRRTSGGTMCGGWCAPSTSSSPAPTSPSPRKGRRSWTSPTPPRRCRRGSPRPTSTSTPRSTRTPASASPSRCLTGTQAAAAAAAAAQPPCPPLSATNLEKNYLAPIDSNYLIIDLYITPFVSKYLTPLTF